MFGTMIAFYLYCNTDMTLGSKIKVRYSQNRIARNALHDFMKGVHVL